MPSILETVAPSLLAGAFGIITAFTTAKLTAQGERKRFERDSQKRLEDLGRDLASKYAELRATSPKQAEALRDQFAGAYLHVLNAPPDTANRFFLMKDFRSIIGRDGDINLTDVDGGRSLSQRHASIELTVNGAFLRDFGSTNGTLLNGAKFEGKVLLRDKDSITFGIVKTVFHTLEDA
jgi:predicted outer membrane lipoprotein